jgi:hypothetical protein
VSASVGVQREVAARHEAAHALAYIWQGLDFAHTEIDARGLGWTGPAEPRSINACVNAVVCLVGPVVEWLEITEGDVGATLAGVLATWREAQDEGDLFEDDGDDYYTAGAMGDAMLPLAFAFVQAGRQHIADLGALLLASPSGRLTYEQVAATARPLDWEAVMQHYGRAQALLAKSGGFDAEQLISRDPI